MLRKAVGVALLGACAYAVADNTADSLMYLRIKRLLLERAAQHQQLQQALGQPLVAGPWYNSTVQITHDGHIATVTIPLRGTQRASDVTVRAVRHGGLRWTLLYNLTGGEWDVLVMQAVIGMGPGGIPESMSLLQLEEPPALTGAAADACIPCGAPRGTPHQPQQSQQ